MQEIYHFIGIWKFKDTKVSIQQLQELATEWAKDEKYLSLHIRKCSQDQFGIAFEYSPLDTDFNEYTEVTKDFLYKRFGSGLVGWDLSGEYCKVK